jgi:UDP-glucose 4-epimerase
VRVLVTGGMGYIGQHVVAACAAAGHDVDVVDSSSDNLSAANRDLLRRSTRDVWIMSVEVFSAHVQAKSLWHWHAVIHLAALTSVSQSIGQPATYAMNNVAETLALLNTMVDAGCKRFVFASSAAAQRPEASPYGFGKKAIEDILVQFRNAYEFEPVSLRFFNVAGGEFPELHEPETHLIPNAIDSALYGKELEIFGTDYGSPDGTAIRDYVNARDVADACVRALTAKGSLWEPHIDIGTGVGHSVRDVIRAVEHVTGKTVLPMIREQREGDIDVLLAAPRNAYNFLGWSPKHSTLLEIVKDAVALRRPLP